MQTALSATALVAAGLAGAAVVTFGGLYALFLAWHYMQKKAAHRRFAYAFYACLALSFGVLSAALRLDAFWNIAIVFLLAAYLVAPHLIWRLTVATHAGEHDTEAANVFASKSTGRTKS